MLEPDAPDRRGRPQPEEPLARRRHDGHLHREQVPDNVADLDPGSGAFLTPGTGILILNRGGKKPRSGSGMNIRIIFPRA